MRIEKSFGKIALVHFPAWYYSNSQFLMVRLFANYSYNFKYLKQPTFWVQGGIQGDKRQEEGFKGEIEVNRKWTYLLYNLTLLDTK